MLASTRTMLGLDQPLYVQYGTWLWKALHLDFGISFASQRPVLDDMLNFLPATLELAGAALVLILLTSVPLGIWAARHRDRLPDFAVRFIAFLGVSMPNFWLAFLLVMAFSVYLQWLPAMGYGGWQHIILPAVSIAFMSLAINARLLRASMLGVAGQRHVTWARLRGLSDKQTERRHILRNTIKGLRGSTFNLRHTVRGTLFPLTPAGLQACHPVPAKQVFSRPGLFLL